MEEIFIAIMERIAEKIPELSYIDEDYGQLEAGADFGGGGVHGCAYVGG